MDDRPYLADSAHRRCTAAEASDLGVPVPITTQSLIKRVR